MSRVWRQVQELIYQRWADRWVNAGTPRTPFAFDNEAEPATDAPWARVLVRSRPGGPGTIGAPGTKRMDRAGVVYIDLREPPGDGVGTLSDLAEDARDVFENCRLPGFDIRFGAVDIGDEGQVENGRWWGVTVEARFDYEERK